MSKFRLDRTAFRAHTVEEAANHHQYYKGKSWLQRLEITAYLNSIAYDYPLQSPPRLDRTKFKAKARQ